MSQAEENREKSAKTDAVLRPPVATPKPAPPRGPRRTPGAAEDEPGRAGSRPAEEEA